MATFDTAPHGPTAHMLTRRRSNRGAAILAPGGSHAAWQTVAPRLRQVISAFVPHGRAS